MMAASHRVARAVPNESRLDLPDGVTVEVIRAARDGDSAAFAQLVRGYYPRCLRFARCLLRNFEDAEECVQDTFVRVHRALPRYEERERFNAWLFRILSNRCRTARYRARRLLFWSAKLDGITSTSPLADSFVLPDELSRAFAALPGDQREAFLLRHVEGCTYEQIAAIAGVAVTAVRMRVSRACLRLRHDLTDSHAPRNRAVLARRAPL